MRIHTMVKQSGHIINSEVFEFSYAEIEQAFTLQREMDNGLLSKIHSAIDSALNDCDDQEEITRINKLEIDLGEIPFAQISEVIPLKIYRQFKEKLSAGFMARLKTNETEQEKEIADKIKILEFFFLTGSLPWWAGRSKKFSINEAISFLLKNDADNLRDLISRNISNDYFLERLIYQLNREVCEQLFDLVPILSQPITTVEKIIKDSWMTSAQTQKADVPNETNPFIPGSPAQLNNDLKIPHNETTLASQDQARFDLSKNILQKIIDLITNQLSPGSEEQLRSQLKEKIIALFGNSIEIGSLERSIDAMITKDFQPAFELLKNEIYVKRMSWDLQAENVSVITTGEKIYIQNAGLILTATFLPALFKELKWMDAGKFISKEFQLRGLFLLHYMSTGEIAAPEYTLQLNKILMGLNLEEPTPFSIGLTDNEKQEADQLLTDIITHWIALKNSSVEGFQGSFILRDGLLSYSDGHWLLQVEKKGYDILLEHIPWSWKTVQFDWMDTYIDTEW
jgi:hypothetical protein